MKSEISIENVLETQIYCLNSGLGDFYKGTNNELIIFGAEAVDIKIKEVQVSNQAIPIPL